MVQEFARFKKMPYLCTAFERKPSSKGVWKGGRVVDYSGLENRRTERYRGFESLPFRQKIKSCISFLMQLFFISDILHLIIYITSPPHLKGIIPYCKKANIKIGERS